MCFVEGSHRDNLNLQVDGMVFTVQKSQRHLKKWRNSHSVTNVLILMVSEILCKCKCIL